MTTTTQNPTKHYTLNTYADGFGNWHCEIKFTTPMGNTHYANSVMVNAIRQAKTAIRNEITERMMPTPTKRLRYKVSANNLNAMNQLTYLRISEIG